MSIVAGYMVWMSPREGGGGVDSSIGVAACCMGMLPSVSRPPSAGNTGDDRPVWVVVLLIFLLRYRSIEENAVTSQSPLP